MANGAINQFQTNRKANAAHVGEKRAALAPAVPRAFPTWWYESCTPVETTTTEPRTGESTSRTLPNCPETGIRTFRIVALSRIRGWYVVNSSDRYFVDERETDAILPELRDARGVFVCHRGRRVNQAW